MIATLALALGAWCAMSLGLALIIATASLTRRDH